jgi:Zn-dependent protease/CBS domain-containing protein
MFTHSFEIFKLFGFSIRLDLSWFVIAILLTWTLAVGVFPQYYPELTVGTYWGMGVVGALGLFASIVLHEMGHALVARRYDMPIRGITLFIFGGVAELTREPPTAKAEFMVAIGGPIVSILIAVAGFGLHQAGTGQAWGAPVMGVLWYLFTINTVLVIFNMIPAFPLDGGRVLRSILWAYKGNPKWATRITSAIGSGFGLLLIALGIWAIVFQGAFITGLWWALIGLFLRNAAAMSYQHMLVRQQLEGEPVSQFMTTSVTTVPPDITLQQAVDDYIYKYHYKMLPVADDDRLVGCLTTRQIKDVPREEWPYRTVRDVATTCSDQNTVTPDTDAMEAFSKMLRTQTSRLMVVEEDRLQGMFSLKDVMNFLSRKIELEGD